jgi:hypothetical protein
MELNVDAAILHEIGFYGEHQNAFAKQKNL